MDSLEAIYNDVRNWAYYDGEPMDKIMVYARCTECGRFLKHGKVFTNFEVVVKLKGWICKKHGEIEPYYDKY